MLIGESSRTPAYSEPPSSKLRGLFSLLRVVSRVGVTTSILAVAHPQ